MLIWSDLVPTACSRNAVKQKIACDLKNDPGIDLRNSWEIRGWLVSEWGSLLEDVFLLIGLARDRAIAFQPAICVQRNVSLTASR